MDMPQPGIAAGYIETGGLQIPGAGEREVGPYAVAGQVGVGETGHGRAGPKLRGSFEVVDGRAGGSVPEFPVSMHVPECQECIGGAGCQGFFVPVPGLFGIGRVGVALAKAGGQAQHGGREPGVGCQVEPGAGILQAACHAFADQVGVAQVQLAARVPQFGRVAKELQGQIPIPCLPRGRENRDRP